MQGPEVRASGAANTLLFEKNGSVRAENTDGAGLIGALADLGVYVRAGQRIVMVGAGGAAAGAIEALTRAGARVDVIARRPEQADEHHAAASRRASGAAERARLDRRAIWPKAVDGADAIVSAVPAAAWADSAARAGLVALKPRDRRARDGVRRRHAPGARGAQRDAALRRQRARGP